MAYWANSDPLWGSLTATQKAAAMALLEADNMDMTSATNVLGAMVNRAQKEGVDLGEHVSGKIYQPTIEDNQRSRLSRVVQTPQFQQLTDLAAKRQAGEVGDWVGGATHFLAPPQTMLALEAKEPSKYKNWGPRGANWTGYDEATGQYANTVMADKSHVFLAPDGGGGTPNAAARSVAASAIAATPGASPPRDYSEAVARAPKPKEDGMLGLLSMLGQAGMAGGGMAGTVVPSLASAASPGAATGLQGLFGNMSAFGGGGKGGGGDSGADDALASNAMKSAAGSAQQMQPMQRKPFDMQTLAKMLQSNPNLGALLRRGQQGPAGPAA